ncbi:MAG: FtsX-like permease family protein, partial [Clostridia bacterium]|nr:FtsX-like permease family protein [Clostridia bacterium]
MVPLETLSKLAGYFLIVVLLIGAIILVVLNIFNIRERKYEIGVMTAMGMKKFKVALQFLTEIFVVTIIAVIIGVGVGGVSSVPVTNALLENQIA